MKLFNLSQAVTKALDLDTNFNWQVTCSTSLITWQKVHGKKTPYSPFIICSALCPFMLSVSLILAMITFLASLHSVVCHYFLDSSDCGFLSTLKPSTRLNQLLHSKLLNTSILFILMKLCSLLLFPSS